MRSKERHGAGEGTSEQQEERCSCRGAASPYNRKNILLKAWRLCRWNGAELDYNQDDARQTVVNWIDGTGGTSSAFDFPTKGILQEAVKNCQYWRLRDQNGKPPGVIGYYPRKSVTFIDNHDTGAYTCVPNAALPTQASHTARFTFVSLK